MTLKDIEAIHRAATLAKKAIKRHQKFIELLKPYYGKKVSEIPPEILNQALSEQEKAEKELDLAIRIVEQRKKETDYGKE